MYDYITQLYSTSICPSKQFNNNMVQNVSVLSTNFTISSLRWHLDFSDVTLNTRHSWGSQWLLCPHGRGSIFTEFKVFGMRSCSRLSSICFSSRMETGSCEDILPYFLFLFMEVAALLPNRCSVYVGGKNLSYCCEERFSLLRLLNLYKDYFFRLRSKAKH